jgi:hypothetical protein
MKVAFNLTAWEFDLLWLKMCEKMKSEYAKRGITNSFPNTRLQIIGYNSGKKTGMGLPNLCDLINEDTDVKAYFEKFQKQLPARKKDLQITPGFFYEIFGRIDNAVDPNTPITIKEIYGNTFFIFLGYGAVNEFREKEYITRAYTGYYFSLNKSKICTFDFTLIATPAISGQKYGLGIQANLKEFHDSDPENLLYGEIRPFKDWWTIILCNNYHFLNIAFYAAHVDKNLGGLLKTDLLYGVLTGTSSKQNLLNLECVLLANDKSDDKTILSIHRYLNLRRNHFQMGINEEDLASVEKIHVDGVSIQKIQHFANKTYRIITSVAEGMLVQSRFIIRNDYSSTISIPQVENGKPLRCTLLLNNVNEGQLLVHAYRDGSIIYSTTSFEFSPNLKKQKLIHGFFSITDGRYTDAPLGSKFVMCEDDTDFEIKAFKGEEIEKLREDSVAAMLTEELFKSKKPIL